MEEEKWYPGKIARKLVPGRKPSQKQIEERNNVEWVYEHLDTMQICDIRDDDGGKLYSKLNKGDAISIKDGKGTWHEATIKQIIDHMIKIAEYNNNLKMGPIDNWTVIQIMDVCAYLIV